MVFHTKKKISLHFLLLQQLYETLHVGEHQIKKERDMYTRLEEINTELLPLEQV